MSSSPYYTNSASGSPSSSAVTIPTPGKSILKKPPPPPTSLFSRLTKFASGATGGGSGFSWGSSGSSDASSSATTVSSGGAVLGTGVSEKPAKRPEIDSRPLKRAHFILPHIAVVYPISSAAPPSTPGLKEEKRAVEERERERRRRVVRGVRYSSNPSSASTSATSSPVVGATVPAIARTASSSSSATRGKIEDSWWTMDKVESFYRECCAGCEENPDPGISKALLKAPPTHPRTLDLSGVQLSSTSASILADVFTIEWGLRKLVLRECGLDEVTLKPILHSLLIPNSLTFLSLASNRGLTTKGGAWKLVGVYLSKATSLQFLDLSQNPLDKKAIELIVAALGVAEPSLPNATSNSNSTSSSTPALSLELPTHATTGPDTPTTAKDSSSSASVSMPTGSSSFSSSTTPKPPRRRESVYNTANPDSEEDYSDSQDSSNEDCEGSTVKIKKKRKGSTGGIVSLRLDDCALKGGALDTLARTVRTSTLRNISLRYNRINATGAIALSLMIRDYPDVVPVGFGASATNAGANLSVPSTPTIPGSPALSASSLSSSLFPPSTASSATVVNSAGTTPSSSLTPSPASSVTSLPLTGLPASSPPNPPPMPPPQHPALAQTPTHPHTSGMPPPPPRHPGPSTPLSSTFPPTPHSASHLTPSSHPSHLNPSVTTTPAAAVGATDAPSTGMQTTYTPYVPRSKRKPAALGVPTTPTTPTMSTSTASAVPYSARMPSTATPYSARTPYTPRTGMIAGAGWGGGSVPGTPTLPILTTSSQGGVTAATSVPVGSGAANNTKPNGLGARFGVGVGAKGSSTASGYGYSGKNATLAHSSSLAAHAANAAPSQALLSQVRALSLLPRLGALQTLDLKGNDLRSPSFGSGSSSRSSGISYIAQVLKRNRTLKVLNLAECRLDGAALVVLAEGLKYNGCLETLDLSRNPCCGPLSGAGGGSGGAGGGAGGSGAGMGGEEAKGLEGVQSLRLALSLNTSLKRLFLSSTHLTTLGAISLAEFLPESRSLLHLDLTRNEGVGLAGVMALNEGLKGNGVVRCLDLEVPPGDEAYARLCREILNTCIRNTEAAERQAQATVAAQAEAAAAQGKSKALWGMIEESELARTIGLAVANGELSEGIMDTDVAVQARGCIRQLNGLLSGDSGITPTAQIVSPTSTDSPFSPLKETPEHPSTREGIVARSKAMITELASLIARTLEGGRDTGGRVEELLGINDELTGLVAKVELMEDGAKTPTTANVSPSPDGSPSTGSVSPLPLVDASEPPHGRNNRPTLSLQGLQGGLKGLKGLGVKLDEAIKARSPNSEAKKTLGEEAKEDRVRALGNGVSNTVPSPATPLGASSLDSGVVSSALPSASEGADADETPTTPRIDKGKARAPPEPVEHEKVLSPTAAFLIENEDTEDEDEDASKFPRFVADSESEEGEFDEGDVNSPTFRSRSWVEEEGEVFRKGTVLLGPEEMEGEYAGEDLRRELLEAMVERPAPRAVVDEYGIELSTPSGDTYSTVASPTSYFAEPLSPKSPKVSSPTTPQSSTPLASPTLEHTKPAPRPYISRSRSASSTSTTSTSSMTSIMSLVTPIPEGQTAPSSPALASVPESAQTPSSPRPYSPRTRSSSSIEGLRTLAQNQAQDS